jgi:hypothetical protein
VKIKAITPYNGESSDADGMAILNYHNGNNLTEVQVAITDFTPGVTYGVVVSGVNDFGDRQRCFDYSAAITANPAGNGAFHGTCPSGEGDLSADPIVIIYVDDGDQRFGGDWSAPDPETDYEIRGIGEL